MTAPTADGSTTRPTPSRPPSPKPAPAPKPASPRKADDLDALLDAVQSVPPRPGTVLRTLGELSERLGLAALVFELADRRMPGHAHDAADQVRARIDAAREAVYALIGEVRAGTQDEMPLPPSLPPSPTKAAPPVAGAVSGRGGEVPGSEPARPGRSFPRLRLAVPLGVGPQYDALPAASRVRAETAHNPGSAS